MSMYRCMHWIEPGNCKVYAWDSMSDTSSRSKLHRCKILQEHWLSPMQSQKLSALHIWYTCIHTGDGVKVEIQIKATISLFIHDESIFSVWRIMHHSYRGIYFNKLSRGCTPTQCTCYLTHHDILTFTCKTGLRGLHKCHTNSTQHDDFMLTRSCCC